MEILKIFVISSVVTLIIVFLYFLYQTHRIKNEIRMSGDQVLDDSLDSYKLKCPSGYSYSGTSEKKDHCNLDINTNCSDLSRNDCKGYCTWIPLTSGTASESDNCSKNKTISYPTLDIDNVPELNRTTDLGDEFKKRCNNSDDFDWPAITPYCDHIRLQQG